MFMDGAGNINILGRFQAMPKDSPERQINIQCASQFHFQ